MRLKLVYLLAFIVFASLLPNDSPAVSNFCHSLFKKAPQSILLHQSKQPLATFKAEADEYTTKILERANSEANSEKTKARLDVEVGDLIYVRRNLTELSDFLSNTIQVFELYPASLPEGEIYKQLKISKDLFLNLKAEAIRLNLFVHQALESRSLTYKKFININQATTFLADFTHEIFFDHPSYEYRGYYEPKNANRIHEPYLLDQQEPLLWNLEKERNRILMPTTRPMSIVEMNEFSLEPSWILWVSFHSDYVDQVHYRPSGIFGHDEVHLHTSEKHNMTKALYQTLFADTSIPAFEIRHVIWFMVWHEKPHFYLKNNNGDARQAIRHYADDLINNERGILDKLMNDLPSYLPGYDQRKEPYTRPQIIQFATELYNLISQN